MRILATGLLFWFVISGIAAFVVFGHDKIAAVENGRRVPERRLWWVSLTGGVWGGWLAMIVFRHKIAKLGFCAVMTVIAAVHLWLLLMLWRGLA